MGGLGNQLFQYAFSRYIEFLTGHPSVLYTGIYDQKFNEEGLTLRNFSLDIFNTDYVGANGSVVCEKIITENDFTNKIQFNNTFFKGYWQCIDYYGSILDTLADELSINKSYISNDIQSIADMIRSTESLSLHVRRTDYLNPTNQNIFCQLTQNYYETSIKCIIDKIGCKPILYIFSDDYDYVKSEMENFMGCKTVIMPPRKDYEDFYLMSAAKHHIIANSSFSYWSALLSNNTDSITAGPKYWFKHTPTPRLYLDSWICIENHRN